MISKKEKTSTDYRQQIRQRVANRETNLQQSVQETVTDAKISLRERITKADTENE